MLVIPKLNQTRRLKRIAVLTSGGDAPGMNAAIRAVVRYSISRGAEVVGVIRGYSGLIGGDFISMDLSSVANIIQRGGTILKTDRCEPFFQKSVRREAAHLLKRKGIEALVAIGGDGTFAGAHLMEKETGFPIVGIPGTIDNDIPGCDETIGFDTAVNTALESIDRIRDTASSHDRLFIVEVMGRDSGFIALQVGLGGGAETTLVPERDESVSSIAKTIDRGLKRGKKSSILVVAEGPKPGFSTRLAQALTKYKFQPRVCILGHIQRGGVPTARDRFLASTLGAAGVAYLMAGKSQAMVAVQDSKVVFVPFKDIAGKHKPLPEGPLELARILAG